MSMRGKLRSGGWAMSGMAMMFGGGGKARMTTIATTAR